MEKKKKIKKEPQYGFGALMCFAGGLAFIFFPGTNLFGVLRGLLLIGGGVWFVICAAQEQSKKKRSKKSKK